MNNIIKASQPRSVARQKAYSAIPALMALSACGGGGEDTASDDRSGAEYRVVPLTGDDIVDATSQGSRWATSDGVLTYAVANGFNEEYWLEPDQVSAALSGAMRQVAYFTDLRVENLGEFDDPISAGQAGADIVLSLDGYYISALAGDSVWAVAFFPDTTEEGNEEVYYPTIAGDLFLNINSDANTLSSYEPGSQGYVLLLHELGHALGLKHPHDDGGTGRPTYADLGLDDSERNSVMTYTDMFDDVVNDPATFMVYDVLTLMHLYGINDLTNAGATVHAFDADGLFSTIWDASGVDVIDLSGSDVGWMIDLPEFTLTDLVPIKVGYALHDGAGATYTFRWLLGDYEDVVGAAGDDTILGNSFSNELLGGAGNDLLAGYGGNDLLAGGIGIDTFLLSLGWGSDIVLDFTVGEDVLRFLDGDLELTADLSSDSDGNAVFTLVDGSSLTLQGVLASEFMVA